MRLQRGQIVINRDDYTNLVAIGNLLAFRAERAEVSDQRLGAAWGAEVDRIAAQLRDSGQCGLCGVRHER